MTVDTDVLKGTEWDELVVRVRPRTGPVFEAWRVTAGNRAEMSRLLGSEVTDGMVGFWVVRSAEGEHVLMDAACFHANYVTEGNWYRRT